MRSLASRIATVTVALVTLAVILAVGGAWLSGQRVAQSAVADSLSSSQSIQRYLQDSTAREVALTTDLVAADPHFTAYLVEAIRGGLGQDRETDLRSILDQVDERRREMGFDFAMMLDADGQVLVRTDRPEPARESRATQPLVAGVMADLVPDYGPWREGNRLYNAAVVPVTTAFEVVGFMITGLAIDDEVATNIKRVTGVDVVFIALQGERASLAATTLDRARSERLMRVLDQQAVPTLRADRAVERVDVDFDGEKWVGRAEPIVDAGGNVLGAVITIDSLDARLAGHRTIQTTLLVAGILAVLLSLFLSILVARRVARPVSALARVADRAAQGDYDQPIDTTGKDEVATLARAISRLLSDLRDQREIASYVSELSQQMNSATESAERTVAAAATMAAPAPGDVVLITLQWRDPGTGAAALRSLEDWLPQLAQLASRHQARLVPGGGASVQLIFQPDKHSGLQHTLSALLALAEQDSAPPAMAVSSGEIVVSGVDFGGSRNFLVSGKPVVHCERLLSEAGSGRLLLSPAAHQRLKHDLRAAGATIKINQGLVSAKSFYQLVSLPTSDPDATAQMDATAEMPVRVEPGASSQPARPYRIVRVGDLLGERFEILALIGEGAMGRVFKARDHKLDDIVALKLLKPQLLEDPRFAERAKSEIRLARRITHPNVLRTHDFWEMDGIPMISMEYVRGIPLSQLLKRTGRLKLAAGLRVCNQVLQGLDAAHEAGVLHRDIKPDNIILDQRGNARLMDFGIARQSQEQDSSLTRPGSIVGTANYMAPEVVLGQPTDQRSDIYAMGITINEIFTGKLPFKEGASVVVCMAHVNEAPTRPSSLWADIPPALEQIILKCLAKEPEERFANAAALLKALTDLRRVSAAETGPG